MTERKDPGLFIFEKETARQTDAIRYPGKPYNPLIESLNEGTSYSPTTLYEYSLGLKNIDARFSTYKEAEVFVSKPIPIKESVMEVELEASEEHPVFDEISGEALGRRTSVEYYISYQQKPSPSDWLPILPKDETVVKGERLLLVGGRAMLRFPAQLTTIELYENGLKLPKERFLVLNNQEVNVLQASANSIYTISYTPDSYRQNPWSIQLNDYKQYVQQVTEVFERGTGINKTLQLSHSPYVDIEKILADENYNPNTSAYRPIQVRLVNASIQGKNRNIRKLVEPYRPQLLDEAYTYNKTLYLNKSWSDMKPYNLDENDYYGGFDYYHHKDKLTFTEHFNVRRLQENLAHTHGNADIEVTYDALVTDFRLKIILRRNTTTEVTATPKVNDYQLRFKTID